MKAVGQLVLFEPLRRDEASPEEARRSKGVLFQTLGQNRD
jgi:hypothetical protein